MPAVYKGLVHGTRWGYQHYKCRCDLCVRIEHQYQSDWRNKNREKVRAQGRESKRRISDRTKVNARQRKYRLENIEYYRAFDQKRKNRWPLEGMRGNQPWSRAEDKIAMKKHLTVAEKAVIIGRSYAAVSNRIVKLRKESLIG